MSPSSSCLCLAAAICLYGCLFCTDAAPTETAARSILEPKSESLVSAYVKQQFILEKVSKFLYENLDIAKEDALLTQGEKADLLPRIPKEILTRISKWNERPMIRKFEELNFIGTPKTVLDHSGNQRQGWSFLLDRSVSEQRITKLTMSVHLTPESRRQVTALRLSVYKISKNSPGRIPSRPRDSRVVTLPIAATEEILADFSSGVKPIIKSAGSMQNDERLELFFLVVCLECAHSALDVEYLVMECKVRVQETNSVEQSALMQRETGRELRASQVQPENLFTNGSLNNSEDLRSTRKCSLQPAGFRLSCCVESIVFDFKKYNLNVLSPSKLNMNYCIGECEVFRGSPRSLYKSQHALLLAILRGSLEMDIEQCCTVTSYGTFQVLTVTRRPGRQDKVAIKTIDDILATGCACG